MNLYSMNGFYYIQDCTLTLDWLTENYNSSGYAPYFMLNNTTIELFKKDILPLIINKEISCDIYLLNSILKYRQVETRSSNLIPVEPDPINKPLMPHQIHAVELMLTHPRYGFFLGTGTGKTLIAISFLLTTNIISGLIVTPKKVIDQYKSELNKYIPNNNFTVINYEQLSKYKDKTFTVIIVDESHRAKNVSSHINSDLKILASKADNVYLFTGTPQDKRRHEIFAQLYLLDTKFMPGKTRFLNRFFTMDDYYQPKKEIQSRSYELTEMINSITWGKETNAVINLTPEIDHIIECELNKTLYDQLVNDRILSFSDDSAVVADSKAKLKLRLRQLCSGFLRVEKETMKGTKKINNTKNGPLKDLLLQIKNGIIYTEFNIDMQNVSKVCTDNNLSFVCVNGTTSTKKANEFIERFKNKQVDFLVIQSKCGNAGLDLTCTNNIIFYTLPTSYITFTQCKGRINRKGQTKECNYYYLMCKDSLEYECLNALKRKKSYTTKIFKIYK